MKIASKLFLNDIELIKGEMYEVTTPNSDEVIKGKLIKVRGEDFITLDISKEYESKILDLRVLLIESFKKYEEPEDTSTGEDSEKSENQGEEASGDDTELDLEV